MKLERVINLFDDEKELEKFLSDLLSPKEYQSLKERWKVVELLKKELSYRQISEQLGVSTATVTRVARCLSNPKGGYALVFEKIIKP